MIPADVLLDPASTPEALAEEYSLDPKDVRQMIRAAEYAEVRRRLVCGYTAEQIRQETGAGKAFIRRVQRELDRVDAPSLGQYLAMVLHLMSQLGPDEKHLQVKCLAQLKEVMNYGAVLKRRKAPQLKTGDDVRAALEDLLGGVYSGELSPVTARVAQPLLRLASQITQEDPAEHWTGQTDAGAPSTREEATQRALRCIRGGRDAATR